MWLVCTCACESCVNVKTCRSSPSTATRCPCLGPVGGVCGPQLRPWSARWCRPAESCAPRWIWTTDSTATSAVQLYSWENLSWRLTERRGRTCDGNHGRLALMNHNMHIATTNHTSKSYWISKLCVTQVNYKRQKLHSQIEVLHGFYKKNIQCIKCFSYQDLSSCFQPKYLKSPN